MTDTAATGFLGATESKEEPVPSRRPLPDGSEDDMIFGPSGFLSESKKDANLTKLLTSIVEYAKFRVERLESASKSNDTAIERLKASILGYNTELTNILGAGITKGTTHASTEKEKSFGDRINEMIDARTRTLESLELVKKHIQKYCGADQAGLKRELETKIRTAIENLRKEVSGDSGEVIRIRREIEKYLITFTDSWQAFKNSYQLNLCLTGGAGVGKSTLARAAAKCFNAFGILASDVYKEPEPRDFIGQYIGQTTPKVFSILYGALEGVVFIDEAYAIGQTPKYGQEFIDALVLFTQKFPGHISIIVAGYKKDMDEHFFKKNEGLNRRFPNQFELLPYPFTTINKAMIGTTASKLSIADTNRTMVEKTLQFHTFLASLAYLDTTDVSSDDPGALFNTHLTRYFPDYFSKLQFNLEPLIRILYLTNSVQKRDVMKAYILKYKFGIQPADLFPNQMGDVQNLVSEILKQDNVIRGGVVTFMDAVAALNNYFKIRDPHRFQIIKVASSGGPVPAGASTATPTPSSDRFVIHFCPHAQSPSSFEANVLRPLFGPLFEKEGAPFDFFAEINDEKDIKRISDYIDKLYTAAIQQFSKDFEEQSKAENNAIKLPGSIRYAFIKQQMDLLNFEIKSRQEKAGVVGAPVLLSYFDTKSSDVSDTFDVEGATKLTLPPGKSLTEICMPSAPSTRSVWFNRATASTAKPTQSLDGISLAGITPEMAAELLRKNAELAASFTAPSIPTTGGGAALPVLEAKGDFDPETFKPYLILPSYRTLIGENGLTRGLTFRASKSSNAPLPPDNFIIKNATINGNCDVKFTKISEGLWKATQIDGRELVQRKLKRKELEVEIDEDGGYVKINDQKDFPLSYFVIKTYFDISKLAGQDPEFETDIVALSCSSTAPASAASAAPASAAPASAPTTGGGGALPVLETIGNFDGLRIYLVFKAGKILASPNWLYSKPSDKDEILYEPPSFKKRSTTLPNEFIVKKATINGNCDVKFTKIDETTWKVTQVDGSNLKKTKMTKGELKITEFDPKNPSKLRSPTLLTNFPLSYHSNYPEDVTIDEFADDYLTEITTLSCSSAASAATAAPTPTTINFPKKNEFTIGKRYKIIQKNAVSQLFYTPDFVGAKNVYIGTYDGGKNELLEWDEEKYGEKQANDVWVFMHLFSNILDVSTGEPISQRTIADTDIGPFDDKKYEYFIEEEKSGGVKERRFGAKTRRGRKQRRGLTRKA